MPACAGIWPALTAVFSVHMLGYHYGIAQYAFLILITLVVSVGTVGVPGTATITSTAVFAALGLPIELVVVFAPISTIVDMARTMTNVTGAKNSSRYHSKELKVWLMKKFTIQIRQNMLR